MSRSTGTSTLLICIGPREIQTDFRVEKVRKEIILMPFGQKTSKVLSLLFLYSRSMITVVSGLFLIFRGLSLPWKVFVILILFVVIQRPNELSCWCELFETISSISSARESLDKRLQVKVIETRQLQS